MIACGHDNDYASGDWSSPSGRLWWRPIRPIEVSGGRCLHPCPCPARQGGLGSRGSSLTLGCDRRRDGDRGVRHDRPARVPNLHDLDLFPELLKRLDGVLRALASPVVSSDGAVP